MDFIFVTGKLGQGKTLASISKIKQRIERGCPVATNCDIFLDKMFHRKTDKPRVMRIPDKPTLRDLECIGRGRPKNKGYDESKNGLLVLDECGDWFNSRNWQDKSRAGVNSWFRHARKLGWDVYMIVQDISLIDSQARDSLAASIARCKRMDKISIPFITSFSKLFLGYPIRPARLHVARVEDADGLLQDRWAYRGSSLYRAYDTEQIFNADYQHSTYSLLTPWHIYGRHAVTMNRQNIMRLTKIYWKRFSRPAVAFTSFAAACALNLAIFLSILAPSNSDNSSLEQHAKTSTPDQAEPEPPPSIAETYGLWKYRGSMVVNGHPTYYFQNENGIKLNSRASQLKGMAYRELSYCAMELVKGDESVIIECDRQQLSSS